MRKEIAMQSPYLKDKKLKTIYFGGGTPSLLSKAEIATFLEDIGQKFILDQDCEITLEANPDDISIERLKEWWSLGINRLSIGIQSFNDLHLEYLHRAHNAIQASKCVEEAVSVGFRQISIDLIYGIPADDHGIWENDLEKALSLPINHLSAYCLTIEEKTTFGRWLKQNKIKAVSDHFAAEQFELLLKETENFGFEQYEISNFAKNGNYSKHNTSYWKGDEYLGIGPSAHSFNGKTRQWNVSNNGLYIKSLAADELPAEIEVLEPAERANELIMTGLRTKWGCELGKIEALVPNKMAQLHKEIEPLIDQELLILDENILLLTQKGKLKADYIASSLFFI